jgi:DNA-binding response OmpR family regulator
VGKILVIEDNEEIADILTSYLEQEGYAVHHCRDGRLGLTAFGEQSFALVLLDVGLPGLDGYTVCREIRKTSEVPVLMVSARDDALDKILGLEVGADDYMVKPFNPQELLIRVSGLLRRARRSGAKAAKSTAKIVRGPLTVEPESRRVYLEGKPLTLTRIEFGLLLALVTHPGQILSREHLMERVWEAEPPAESRLIDSHLRNLRAKLRAVNPAADLIRSVRGVGYRLD